ncbi:acetyl-CoA carboxylase [Aneurinibacillus terranovensis]|uniref:acetyl-CoA carboxylase n=1 Tax=Aneurinibacillus terranovensis TaxID=278991 RepID=UPI000416E040|nr:acetyl-CoA carboxylase [Aneurinibacillus terranovensis]
MANQSIISPVPGVFYRKPSPDQPEFVVEGQEVKAGDTIGLIEVMKNFYEVKAEHDGIVERFSVDSEDIVDAGQEIAIVVLK